MQDGRIFFCNCISFNRLAIGAQIRQQILVTKSEGKRVLVRLKYNEEGNNKDIKETKLKVV
jgi:hypothetical protein